MKKLIDLFLPDKTDRVQVAVTALHDDGSYDYKGDYCEGRGTYQPLYDETGNEIQPTVDAQPEITLEMLEALQILLGGG